MYYYIEGGGGGCFPAVAEVKLKNGKSVPMSELEIGDQVQTGIDRYFISSNFRSTWRETLGLTYQLELWPFN